ncbi:alpha/beta hydrolase family protein [Brevundimonas sp. FT23042]|uniref:alpha/beta hydrolase family protein n=1 Tax=Brevundimonas sp. FT23042 TaxID=3393749 RepID=UPI003B586B5D
MVLRKIRVTGLVAVAALSLAACVKVDVPERAFFWPDARLARENITLPANPPPEGAETLVLRYAEGPIGATRVRSADAARPLILFCGGNMFRREASGGSRAEILAPFGDALMFDYPGYGDTAGLDTFANFRAVGEVVADEARRQADAEGRRLIVWGHSLGGIVCSEMAARTRADILVLETTTPGARATVEQQVGLMRPFVRVTLAPALETVDIPAALNGYPGKVVVLEAGKDDTLPPALSRRLARALEAQGNQVDRIVFPAAGHNDVGRQPEFVARLTAALAP